MAILSESVHDLLKRVDPRVNKPAEQTGAVDFDVVIIGSGYGGSVAACHLAGRLKAVETPLSVCVLERGREYQAGEFPEDIARLWPHVQVDSAVGSIGRRDALFDFRGNHGVSALVGCALGGTSQINAGVVLRPDARVFDKVIVTDQGLRPAWPKKLRNKRDLIPYFRRVEKMLEAAPLPNVKTEPLPKFRAMQRLHHGLKHDGFSVKFSAPPIAVHHEAGVNTAGIDQPACTQCGNCCTGCNAGAKNTLTMNYLPQAKARGATLYTQVLVKRIAREIGPNSTWRVYFEPNHPEGIDGKRYLRASHVIVAAGVLGSSEILLRSREATPEEGEIALTCSDQLGRRFSCNGDSIGAGYDHTDFIHGSQINSLAKVGPCITGMIKVRPQSPNITDDFIVQEGTIPSSVQWLFQELGSFSRFVQTLGRNVTTDFSRDVAAPSSTALEHSQIYLSMGHDGDAGELYLDAMRDRVRINWQSPGSDPTYENQDALLARANEHLGGTYLPNPARKLLDEGTLEVLKKGPETDTTPIVLKQTITVHPLGGCALADDGADGVVNDACQVFSGSSGDAVHPGLYVMDGSVIPTSLGANPLLTIAAIAERAVELMQLEKGWHRPDETDRSPVQRVAVSPVADFITDQRVDLSFRESLDIYLSPDHRHASLEIDDFAAAEMAAKASNAKSGVQPTLKLQYRIDDAFNRLLDDPSHCAAVDAETDEAVCSKATLEGINCFPQPIGRVRVMGGELALFRMVPTAYWSRLWVGVRRELSYFFGRYKRFSLAEAMRSTVMVICNMGMVLRYLDVSSQKREVIYRLRLESLDKNAPRRFLLEGFKLIQNRHDLDLLDATTRVYTRIRRDDENGEIVATGTMVVQLEEFFRSKHSRMREFNQDTVQIAREPDGIVGATALISTGTMMAKTIAHVFFASFRQADYPIPLPVLGDYIDPSGKSMSPRFHAAAGQLRRLPKPTIEAYYSESNDAEKLAWLTRYQQQDNQRPPVMLVHGFGTSSLTYAMDTQTMPLAQYLWDAGFDVWLLDNRISIAGPHAHRQWGLDPIAAGELPWAIDFISKSKGQPVGIFAHCVGGLVTLMALLKDHKLKDSVSGLMISQVGTVIEASTINKFKSPIAAFLESYVGLKVVDAYPHTGEAAPDTKNSGAAGAPMQWRGRLIDRMLSAYHFPDGEVCDSACCHRVSGMYGLAFHHRNIGYATHDNLHRMFGPANMSTFKHLARIFDAKEPVTKNGERTYVSRNNLSKGLDVPMCFIHGADNEVFNVATLTRTIDQLTRIRTTTTPLRGFKIDGYGHQDVIIGQHAHRDVFPLVGSFFSCPTDSSTWTSTDCTRPVVMGGELHHG